jgi:hypothetical protein
MKYQWISGAFAFVVLPATIFLVGYYEYSLDKEFFFHPSAFLYALVLLPGICIGLGLLLLLSLVKGNWLLRASAAAMYCGVMHIFAAGLTNPIVPTHAVLMSMPQ